MLTKRHTQQHIESWRQQGAVLLNGFLQPEEVAAVLPDFLYLYGQHLDATRNRSAVDLKAPGKFGVLSRDQFLHFDDMPFEASSAINLVALHPALIAFAKDALGTDDVRLYQSHTWAKFTGETDYDQSFHCDFKNHTLTVPADDTGLQTVNFMIYFTEVTDAHGAIHFVPHGLSDPITGRDRTIFPSDEQQEALRKVERSGAAGAGSVFAYGIDVFHRGTNLTAPGGYRFTLTASYHAAGNDMIGWSAWPYWFRKPWHHIIDNATPEQLTCLGIPAPGHRFWTPRTIARTRERWPGWNHLPYEAAL
jgi:ectoine hydroxylase-related dioxygenase (phytanoyl-CoA dioxygenase family)